MAGGSETGKAGGSETGNSAFTAADETGAGGRHGARTTARERVAGQKKNPAGESYGVGGRGEVREAYGVTTEPSRVRGNGRGREACRVAENPRGDRQGLGGGVKSPQGIDTPGVETLPRRDKNPGVDTEGDGLTEEDGRGRGGDGTPPPPERARTAEPTAATTAWRASQVWRRRRARVTRQQTMIAQGLCRINLTTLTAPGLKTACT